MRYITLFGGEAISKLCVMGAFAYLAHVLPPSEYGVVELALSITLFFVLSVESGMGLYGAGILAAHPERLPQLVPQVMVLRVVMGAPLFALLLLGARRFAPDGFGILSVNGLAVLLTPFLVQWVFQGLRQMQWVAIGSAARNLTFAVLILALARPGMDIRLVAVAEVGGIAALALFNMFILRTRVRVPLDWRGCLSGARGLFLRVWFMGLGDVTWAGIWYGPAVIVGSLGQAEQVAWITASVRVVVGFHTFVWLFFFNLLPNLAKELSVAVEAWRVLVMRSLRTSLWPAFLIAVAATLGAPVAMPLVFGASYTEAVLPVRIAIWMIPITWFSGHFRFSLIAAGQRRSEVVISAISAAVGIAAAYTLGRAYGSVGAASALVIAGLTNLVLAVLTSHRLIGAVDIRSSLAPPLTVAVVSLGVGLATTVFAGAVSGTAVGCAIFILLALKYNSELLRAMKGALAG